MIGASALAASPADAAATSKPAVTGLSTHGVKLTGGSRITVSGRNFTKVTSVVFGTAKGKSVKVISKTKLTVVVPKHAAGTVDVQVVTRKGKSAKSSKDRLSYIAAPTVSGLSPASGSTAGGTAVTVKGNNFTSVRAVTFAGRRASIVRVVSSKAVVVIAPSGALGQANVAVTTSFGTSKIVAASRYKYTPVSVPPAGTTLANISESGEVNVISNPQGQGFTVVVNLIDGSVDESHLQSFDVAGNRLAYIAPGSFEGACGAADVISNGRRILITEDDISHAAEGINPATDTLTMTAFDGTTGTRLWTSTLVSNSQNGVPCHDYDGYIGDFSATFDGSWGVLQPNLTTDPSQSQVVNLATGQVQAKPNLYGTLGNSVAVIASTTDSTTTLALSNPATWTTLGTLTVGGVGTGHLDELDGFEHATLVPSGAQLDADPPTHDAITPDAGTLAVLDSSKTPNGPDELAVYSLPSLTPLWQVPQTEYGYDIQGISDSIIVISDDSLTPTFTALDIKTGQQLWHLQVTDETAQVCMLTSSQLVLAVNGQLAFLNASTGAQTGYTTNNSENTDVMGSPTCPSLLAGGVSGVTISGEYTLTQLANP